MTHEPGRGIAFQRHMSLDGTRFRSSSEDDRETKDAAVEQPGTGTLFHGRHRRRAVCHPGAPGSPPVDRPEPEAVWLQAIAPRRAWTHCALPVQGQRLLPRTAHAPDCAVALRWPPARPARAARRTLCQALWCPANCDYSRSSIGCTERSRDRPPRSSPSAPSRCTSSATTKPSPASPCRTCTTCAVPKAIGTSTAPVSYTHLRAHE